MPSARPPPFEQEPMTLRDAVLLIGCAVFGMILGKRLRLPAAAFLGPLILSAALHLWGITASAPPASLIVAAQVVLSRDSGLCQRIAGSLVVEGGDGGVDGMIECMKIGKGLVGEVPR
ncbi:MAG: AbrB family transcriptional regulator, partial [Alphaproteobacteria bacterium]|nr:AbrB family transcriptional regulator [Alphaproteobacteria bacterium]